MKTLIIAEAGVNHNGSLELAKKLVDVAVEAKADIVKFQTFNSHLLVTKKAAMAEYQKQNTGKNESQYDLLKKLELTKDDYVELHKYCQQKGIEFLSTAFDLESVEFLASMGMSIFKIPSGEISNYPYLKKIAQFNPSKVILSTGMSTFGDIEAALEVLLKFGIKREQITILHCNTEYPTPMEDVNLLAMKRIGDAFGTQYGYSDHTLGTTIPIAAVALGATVIEKHFTLSRTLVGADHAASLEPQELKEMVTAIRNVEKALGDGIKKISYSEEKNKSIARKSIIAKRAIGIGEEFTEDNLITKRPGTGLSPMMWESVVGKKASKNFEPEDFIEI